LFRRISEEVVIVMASRSAAAIALELAQKANVARSQAERALAVSSVAGEKGFRVVSFLNANAVVLATQNPAFRQALMSSDYLFRDGVGCEVLMRAAGINPGVNCNGTDLIAEVATQLQRRRVALFGSSEPYLSKAAAVIAQMGVEVVSRRDGFRAMEEYAELVAQSRPEVVLLGMGMPKQELLSGYLRDVCGERSLIIINGGAFFDFLAGRFSRAPLWLRKLRLEWFYRFLLEPRRLFRRYFVDGVRFALLVLKVRSMRNGARLS